MKTKYEEDTKRTRLVQVAKHDEALNMISLLQAENECLKQQLNTSQNPSMHCASQIYQIFSSLVLIKALHCSAKLSSIESKSPSSSAERKKIVSIPDQNAIEVNILLKL